MQRKCNMCGKWGRFYNLDWLSKKLKEEGFPYKSTEFETLATQYYECPHCHSSDRDRLYKLYLEKYSRNRRALLDFAPSLVLQRYILDKKRWKTYRSADLYMDGVDDKVDITNMHQYKDGQFDFFICSHILEHVDDQKALAELYRILAPGGSGILMTPIIDRDDVFDEDLNVTDEHERWRRFAQDDHVRLYSKSVFLRRVQEAGFIVHQLDWRKLGLMNMVIYGINPKSVLYIVEKPADRSV